jgi:hypothetical protein
MINEGEGEEGEAAAKEQAKMVEELLSIDYHITKQEIHDYAAEEKEREYDSVVLPHEAAQQIEMEEELLSKEIAEQANRRPDGRYGFGASEILEQQTAIEEANRRHTQHNMQRYKENMRKMMILFEQDRLRLLSWISDIQAGKEEPYVQINSDEELDEIIKFMYGLKHDIEELQKELKEWEQEEEEEEK